LRKIQFSFQSLLIILGSAILMALSISCVQDRQERAISQITVELNLLRFDLEFAQTPSDHLHLIKQKYPYFFPQEVADSIWEAKMNDSLQMELAQEVRKVFLSNDELKDQIHAVFQHIKYYFPDLLLPKSVVTTTSEVDYQHQIIITDSLVVIALDTFLGVDHPFYKGVYDYIKIGMTKDRIPTALALEFATQNITPINRPTLIEAMIHEGQKLYVAQLLCPRSSEQQLLGYTQQEYEWADANARFVWEYFITNDYLFSTEPKLFNRFVALAPFSKFYLEFDQDTPGGLGKYVGLQIVKVYMEKAKLELPNLLKTRPEVIFNAAKYKP